MADLDSSEVRQRTTDIKEWIFEAVDKIGAPMQYIENEVELALEDHQAPLPDGLQIIDGIAYAETDNTKWQPMVKTTSVFKKPKEIQGKPIKYRWKDDPEYFIKPDLGPGGWIVVPNRREGKLKIAYKSIALDDRGYPLIPDSSSYQEAIYWYVTMKLTFPKYIGKIDSNVSAKTANAAGNLYFFTQQQWNFYRNQAYAEAMMPTADDMRNIKNDWHKLIPDWDADDSFFKHINDRQTVFNDYYYGY